METFWFIILYVLPGLLSIPITLKGIRDEREANYNTVGDLGITLIAFIFGPVGLLASLLVTYEDVIIIKLNKKL